MSVMVLKNEKGEESIALFVGIVGGEIRIRSGARWDEREQRYVEAEFDVVTQTVKP